MDKLHQFAHAMVHTVFQLKPGEVLVITGDYGSNHNINQAISQEAYEAGAWPVLYVTEPAVSHGKAADKAIPKESFVALMDHADCWLDTGTMGWLYSDAFERVLAHRPNLRYLLISNLDLDFLTQMFIENHSAALTDLCRELNEMVCAASSIRVANADGSDLTFELDHRHVITIDIGNAGGPGFFTVPALFNIVPKFGSASGKLVMGAVYADPWGVLDTPLTLHIRDGAIVDVESANQGDADRLKAWLASWEEENIYKVAHTNLGLLPKVTQLTGNGILDERMWGTLNWGFGHVTPSEAPPDGNISKSHFDGMVLKGSFWIDGVPVMEDGVFVHERLKPFAQQIIGK